MDKANAVTPQTQATPAAGEPVRRDKASVVSAKRFVSLLDTPSTPETSSTRRHQMTDAENRHVRYPLSSDDTGAAASAADAGVAPPLSKGLALEEVTLPSAPAVQGGRANEGGLLDIARRLSASAEAALVTTSAAALAAAPGGESKSPVQDDLTTLLQRYCSDMYVADARAGNNRMLLGLEAAFPGAAAEFVREGAFLRVRLHVKDEDAFRKIDAERERLLAALSKSTPLQVSVDVVRQPSTPVDPI